MYIQFEANGLNDFLRLMHTKRVCNRQKCHPVNDKVKMFVN